MTMPERSWAYMTTSMTPTPGPEKETVYVPGTPGGQWTGDEVTWLLYYLLLLLQVAATRSRILQMIHPAWDVKKAQGTWNGVGTVTTKVT